MGHKYIKEDDTFSTSRNGTVPKPTQQEVSEDKVLHADGSWGTGGGSGGSSTLDGLDDVDISSPSDGQGLFYDSTEQKWKNADPPSGGGDVTDVLQDGQSVVDENGVARITTPSVPSNLNDLSDVNTSNPTTDDYLGYDPQTNKWVNKPVSGGSGNVDDVKVNGVSVVDQNKVAQIKGYKEITQSEYDALPSSKESDGILYCIKDSGDVMGNVFSPIIYSTEEREIGVWTDGKPLYQKTVHIVESTEKSDVVYTTEITSLNPDYIKLVNAEVKLGSNGNNRWYTAPFNVNYTYYMGVSVCNSEMEIISNTWKYSEAYITIQYTKTTDTPGSGKWASNGALAKHYSLQEQVIGTWIDGKPLYEKVIDCNFTINTTSWYNTQIACPDFAILVFGRAIDSDNQSWDITVGTYTSPSKTIGIRMAFFDSNGSNLKKLIVQYTKTTD